MNGKIKTAFLEIHADENLKKQTFKNIINVKAKKKMPVVYKLAPIMAIFALVIFSAVYFTPVLYISIDVNPSIELSINSFDRVIEVTASNQDAGNIIDSVSLNNHNYIEALEILHEVEHFSQFNDSYTEITVISDNSDEIIKSIESCDFNNQNLSFHTASIELKNEAVELGLSFGKYRAYLELLEINPDVKVEEISRLPMRMIRDMIDNGGVVDEDPEFQYGNGHGNNGGTQGGGGQNQNIGGGSQGGGQGNKNGLQGGGDNQSLTT